MMMMCEKKKSDERDKFFFHETLSSFSRFFVFVSLLIISFCFFFGLRVVFFFLRSHSNQHITRHIYSYMVISLSLLFNFSFWWRRRRRWGGRDDARFRENGLKLSSSSSSSWKESSIKTSVLSSHPPRSPPKIRITRTTFYRRWERGGRKVYRA